MSQLCAGVARIDITPPIGIAHAGWGAQTHQRAAGVDLPLWATALALSDGNETFVIIDIDLIYIWEPEAGPARQAVADLTGLPLSHIRLSYTHTHSGPINGVGWTSWIKEGVEMVGPYDAALPHRLAGVAWAALRNMKPVNVNAGSGSCDIGVNRRFQRPEDGAVVVGRNWGGPVDHEVKVVRFDTLDGKPLATIVNYACHPITVGPDSQLITPDYPGVMKRVVEQATGSTSLFLQGATGDIGPIRGGARNGEHEYKRLGAMLGHAASQVWWKIEAQPHTERYTHTLESGAPLGVYYDDPVQDRDTSLRVGTRLVDLPLKDMGDPEVYAKQLNDAVTKLNELREQGGSDDDIRQMTMLSKRASMRADLARQIYGKTHRTFELQALTIGKEIALIATPGEPFVEIGLRVKQNAPFQHTLFSGYSNVGWAYIPTRDAYPLGGYEVEITPFSPDAADVLVNESIALLRELQS